MTVAVDCLRVVFSGLHLQLLVELCFNVYERGMFCVLHEA
jgi:hypothetical protein